MRSVENAAIIPVKAASRAYEVHVGTGPLATVGGLVRNLLPNSQRAFVVRDSGVPTDVAERVSHSLRHAGLTVSSCSITPSEQVKTLVTLETILTGIASTRHERLDPVIALGGGIVGDLAGLAAASYRRGVPVIQCPTTLLSMVDASVGGKTGVNLLAGVGGTKSMLKNMVGAFHQPHAVVADVSVLNSLPDRTFRCGLAECLKHAMLSAAFGDPGLMDWTVAQSDAILGRKAPILGELVARNVRVKAAVVGQDEREEFDSSLGGRALLNLGHTFGHALETMSGLSIPGEAQSGIEHGEAVSLGLVAAATTAVHLDPHLAGLSDRVRKTLNGLGLPVAVRGIPATEVVIERMGHDKKSAGGRLRLVLPTELWVCRVVEAPDMRAVAAGIDAIRC